jgi:trehalose 6-phosphate phosphatase
LNLWIFDFDGTVSPLSYGRDEAKLDPSCAEFIEGMSRKNGNIVAILSSRRLEDLEQRVRLPGVILGGGSGLAWHFPGGHRILPGAAAEAKRETARKAIVPIVESLSTFPGVEIEDKGWSVAFHYRKVAPALFPALEPSLAILKKIPRTRAYRGPCVVELLMFPHWCKSYGVRRLCQLLRFDPSGNRIVYGGDDENDAVAMRWVLKKGGIALTVGGLVQVRGALAVEDPAALARAARNLAEDI